MYVKVCHMYVCGHGYAPPPPLRVAPVRTARCNAGLLATFDY